MARLDTSTERSFHADVAVDGAGVVHAVWHDNRGGDWNIAYAQLTAAWSAPVYFGAAGVTDAFAAVAVGPDGVVHVSWIDYDSVYLVSRTGDTWGPARKVIDGVGARDAALALDAGTGRLHLVTSARKAGLTYQDGWDLFGYSE